MATDTGINDPKNCFFICDPSGHTGAGNWWLSQDVIMAGADPSTASPDPSGNVVSQVTVRANEGCAPGPGDTVRIDLYVCTPSLNIAPFPPDSLVATTAMIYPVSAFAPSNCATQTSPPSFVSVPWTVSANASDPNGPGHKCLIARCYPFVGSTPDALNISQYLPTDPHYAQHNLAVQPIPSGKSGGMKIKTGNPRRQPELVAIQAVPDLRPTPATLNAILPSLKVTPGFKQISTTPLHGVSLNLKPLTGKDGGGIFDKIEDFFEETVKAVLRRLEDDFHKAAPGGTGAFGRVRIGSRFYANFDFNFDARGAQPGNGYIYHLTQITAAGAPDGGLTVVIVAQ
jgi:hypothetical protein